MNVRTVQFHVIVKGECVLTCVCGYITRKAELTSETETLCPFIQLCC